MGAFNLTNLLPNPSQYLFSHPFGIILYSITVACLRTGQYKTDYIRTGLTDDARYPGVVFEFRHTIILNKKEGIWLIQARQNAKPEKRLSKTRYA